MTSVQTSHYDITYVIPTLNSGKTLDVTLHSLKKQENVHVRIIVVDSYSTDDTLAICQRWGVETLFAEKGNMYRAINVGLKQATTAWVAYINSDDWLYGDSVSKLIAWGNDNNADVVYGRCDYTDQYGRFIYSYEPVKPKYFESVFVFTLGFSQQTTIFRKSLYDSLNGFDENYQLSADRDFFVRAFQLGNKFSFLDDFPVACFRLHSNQLSSTVREKHENEGQKISHLMNTKKTLKSQLEIVKWRLSNIGHYSLRFLRESLLCQKLIYTKNIEVNGLRHKQMK